MQAIYLSYFIDNLTPIYGGKSEFKFIESKTNIIDGSSSNSLILTLPNHIGTHIDFPYHFSNSGKNSSDYDANFWIFRKIGFLECTIEDVPREILNISTEIEILILKTGFGAKRGEEDYWKNQPVFPSRYAKLLRARFPQLRVLGFDLISMTSKLDREEGKCAHTEFLINNDILILEDMCLNNINEIDGYLIISPLLVSNADGIPCTVINFNI